MMETWKPIKNTEGKYEISNFGQVRKADSKTTQPLIDNRKLGYIYCPIKIKNKILMLNVHREVATAFIENEDPSTFTEVDHINFDKQDNRVSNLRWVSHSTNIKQSWYRRKYRNQLTIFHQLEENINYINTK